jgi:hypothetical protein
LFAFCFFCQYPYYFFIYLSKIESIQTPVPKPTKHVLKMIENVEEFLKALKKSGVKKAFSPRKYLSLSFSLIFCFYDLAFCNE